MRTRNLHDLFGECCVYGIREKSDSFYFYVGSTKYSAERRFKSHLKDIQTGNHRNPHFSNKARNIGLKNLVVDTLETVSAQDRFKSEYSWINTLLDKGHPLTNIRLTPWPPAHEALMTPARIAYYIFEALMAPADCGIPENQALYSKMRKIARTCANELLFRHRAELLEFLKTGEMPA